MSRRPLAGIRVLDFTHAAAGPFATMWLAAMGADVMKVEKPGRGDGARYMGEPMTGPMESDYYLGLNSLKRSVLLDLGTPEGVDAAKRLAATCDIVIENFRPGVMDRLDLGMDAIQRVRPGIIYCSISAFSPDGPMAQRPANDIIMQGISGLMSITGEPGQPPVRVGAPMCDYSSGLFALTGILAALRTQPDVEEGQHIRVSMFDATAAMLSNFVPSVVTDGKVISPFGRGHPQIVPYQAFECSDGGSIIVGAFTQGFWRRLCHALGKDEWADAPRYATNADRMKHRTQLVFELQRVFIEGTRDHWQAVLSEADVPNAPVNSLNEAWSSEEAESSGTIRQLHDDRSGRDIAVANLPIRSSAWEQAEWTVAPQMGQDTRAVLREAGLSDEEIDNMASDGVTAEQLPS